MKKYLLLGLLFVGFNPVFSQIKIDINQPDKQLIHTGVLYERIKLPPKNFDKFTGQSLQPVKSSVQWRSLYHALYQADFEQHLPYFLNLKKQVKPEIKTFTFPIGVVNFDYNRINQEAWQNRRVSITQNALVVSSPDDIETAHLFALAPVDSRKLTGLKIKFDFAKQYYFSNLQDPVKYYRIDFDDNRNAGRLVYPGQQVLVNYQSEGLKHIKVTAVMQSGKVYRGGFDFAVKTIAMPTPDETWSNYQANIPYNGSVAQGEVGVFFGSGNTDFTRPIIVSDGFDPGDTRGLPEIYDIVNQQNMINDLRSQGYDLVLVNFNGGDDYIQRNAMLLVKVIQEINSRMQAAGTMKPANQIVVVGPSMSGLVSRYALDYMEQNNLPHNVRNWIAFDSPMKGANVPLGLQHWLHFYSVEADVSGATEALQTLQGPAAKQMLQYHYSATNKSAHLGYPNSLFNSFYNEINNMGFPQQTRKVAVSNGSGYGNGQAYAPGTQTIEYRHRSFWVDLDGDVWALPNHTDKKIFFGVYDELGWWSYEEENIYVNNTDPLDSSPGGTRDTFQELADTDTSGYGDIIAYYPAHSFIPTISAFALQNTNNPYYNIDANSNNLQTPFDKLYYPNTNQSHVTITTESVQWFKHEIINYAPQFTSMPVTEIDEESPYSYTLTASDVNEWNVLNYSVVNMPSWLSYDAQTHTLSGTPDYNDIGTYSVTVKVDDGLDESLQTFNIEVFPKCSHAPQNVWNGNAWSSGMPSSSQYIVFNADYNTQTGAINACSLEVSQGSHLIVTENNPVVVDRNIINNGEIFVANKASLVQVSDKAQISGSGVFKMARDIDNLSEYYQIIYWTSPLAEVGMTYVDILPNAWRYYSFDVLGQNWVFQQASNTIQAGMGYAVSAPIGFNGGTFNVLFEKDGHPFNNGPIDIPVTVNGQGASGDDDWNLLGNPYPSAIDFNQFVADNPNIQGSYYAWTNCAGLDGNNNQASGYSVYSLGGGVSACQNAYTAGRYIASAQGFFVEANTGGQVSFNNGQRVVGHNDNFASRPQIFDRLWLDITADNGLYQQILIGFAPDATDQIDRLYDAKTIDDGSGLNFYSLQSNTKLAIQYVPLLQDDARVIHIGYNLQTSQVQSLNIHLNRFEGVLAQKQIYLHDRLTGMFYDLKNNDVDINAVRGEVNNRFELVITNETLGLNVKNNLAAKIYKQNDKLLIISPETILYVEIFDVDGKVIYASNNLYQKICKVRLPAWHKHVLICRVQSVSDKIFRTKVLF